MTGHRPRDLMGNPLPKYVCSACKGGMCKDCVDVIRVIYDLPTICNCTKYGHDGEPVNRQIKDPETGTVYAPGLTVKEDGSVERDCKADG